MASIYQSQTWDFNPRYYEEQNPNLRANFDRWAADHTNTNWRLYTEQHSDINQQRLKDIAAGKTGPSMWKYNYGADHWNTHASGGREYGRTLPKIVGPNQQGDSPYYIPYKYGGGPSHGVNRAAYDSWLAWHHDTKGRHEGLFGSEQAFYDSPQQIEIRRKEDQKWEEELRAQQRAIEEEAMKQQQEQYELSRRIKSSNPTLAQGAGRVKGKGLSESEARRGGGSRQFRSDSPQFLATLNFPDMAAGSGKKGTTGLNIGGK